MNLKPAVKECSEKFYSYIKFYEFLVCVGPNILEGKEQRREKQNKL